MAAVTTNTKRDLMSPSSTINKRKRDSMEQETELRNSSFRTSGSPSKAGDISDALLHASGHDEDPMNSEFANALAHHNASSPSLSHAHHDSGHDHSLHPNGNMDSSHSVPSASDTAAAALSHHYSMTVPTSTEQSFLSQTSGPESGSSFGLADGSGSHGLQDYGLDALKTGPGSGSGDATSGSSIKPAVGSDEWHKVRRDNHKEVERRRRETINEGINELAKIVPGCEKNKGSILQRAVSFITQLKENESQNIEKWTLEKLLTEQAIAELSSSVDKLKAEVERAWTECEVWKRAAKEAGIIPPEFQGREDGGQGSG